MGVPRVDDEPVADVVLHKPGAHVVDGVPEIEECKNFKLDQASLQSSHFPQLK